MLIPIILFLLLGGAAFITAVIVPEAATGAVLGGGAALSIIVALIAAIIFNLILLPASINFARKESFGAAFKFGEIFAMVGKIGWGKYILSIILVCVIAFIFGLVLGILELIPFIGWILSILALPLYIFFYQKYYANLFE